MPAGQWGSIGDDGNGHTPTAVLPFALLHHHYHGSPFDYAGIALLAALSWLGFPGPGEAAIIAAAIAAAHGHHLDITSVIVSAWFGAAVGGIAGWLVGRHGGRRVVLAGRWLREHREKALTQGNRFFQRYGWLGVYLAPTWVAGVNNMSAARFLAADVVCALAWSLLVGLGAYFLGPSIKDIIADIGLVGGIAIGAAIVAAALIERRRHRRRVASRRP